MISLLLLTASLTLGAADTDVGWTTEEIDNGLSTTLWTRESAEREAQEGLKRASATGAKSGPTYEYKTEHRCQNNGLETPCTAAAAGPCPSALEARNVYRRQLDANGQPTGPWEQVGIVCNAAEAPPARQPGMADIIRAFHDTEFTVAALSSDPQGNRTLVNLPTYLAVHWPAQGFQPEETDTRTLTGFPDHTIHIKPTLASVTYHFGDGATQGPTTSLGGPHPNGDILHTYTRAVTVQARADVTYSGLFRLDDGEWLQIPDTVTITGTPNDLNVLEARNQLVLD